MAPAPPGSRLLDRARTLLAASAPRSQDMRENWGERAMVGALRAAALGVEPTAGAPAPTPAPEPAPAPAPPVAPPPELLEPTVGPTPAPAPGPLALAWRGRSRACSRDAEGTRSCTRRGAPWAPGSRPGPLTRADWDRDRVRSPCTPPATSPCTSKDWKRSRRASKASISLRRQQGQRAGSRGPRTGLRAWAKEWGRGSCEQVSR